ncbi:hypothetical protein FRC02_006535 [Tulasnella sp. 418]|nr:hypothetical protein FRC02_006535 [Tulasnella sp. 418]
MATSATTQGVQQDHNLPIKLHQAELDDTQFPLLESLPSPLPTPNPTKAFWTHGEDGCNPLAREGSEGPLTRDADICIIGSGITGVSTAYHLIQKFSAEKSLLPLKIVILEARDFCSGATGRNGGHLTPAVYSRMHEMKALYGSDASKHFKIERHTVDSILKIIEDNSWESDVDLVKGGHIQLALSDREMTDILRDIELARENGIEGIDTLEQLSKEEVLQQYGASHPGFRIPGSNLWPLKFVTKLFLLASNNVTSSSSWWGNVMSCLGQTSSTPALTLHTHTPVTEVTKAQGSTRRWALATPRGVVETDYVVHATNAYASYLLPHLAGPNGIVPARGQVIATRASVERRKLWTVGWGANEGYEYWFSRPCPSAERPLVILGGGREASAPRFEYNITDDSATNSAISKTLNAFLPAVLPTQFEQGSDPDMEWTGIMA